MSRFNSFSSFGSRGQASFEFILVLVFVLTIVMVLVLPLGQSTQRALEDVFRASTLSSNFAQLHSAIDLARVQGSDSLQPLQWYLPRDSNVFCHIASTSTDVNRISMTILFSKKIFQSSGTVPPGCIDDPSTLQMPCTQSLILPSTLPLQCQGSASIDFFINAEEKGFSQGFALRYIPPTPPSLFPTVDFSVR
jgi:hypothetical protein